MRISQLNLVSSAWLAVVNLKLGLVAHWVPRVGSVILSLLLSSSSRLSMGQHLEISTKPSVTLKVDLFFHRAVWPD